MPQQKNDSTQGSKSAPGGNATPSINPRISPDDFSTLFGDNPAPAAPSGQQPIYSSLGGAMIPFDPNQLANMPAIDPAKDWQTISAMQPPISEGPYAPGATGETAREYQAQYNSPYVTALARHLGVSHPRLANLIDSGVLGMESAQAAHERSLAANGGIEGAGGGIADALAGLTGPQQMRLAHREQLESLPLQYAQEQGGLEQQQATTLAERLRALSEYESNPARVLAQIGRGAVAAGIGANQRLESTQINAQQRFQQELDNNATKLKLAALKDSYSRLGPLQQEHYQQSFLNSFQSHLAAIDKRYDALEALLDKRNVAGEFRNPQDYQTQLHQLEAHRQAEKAAERMLAEHSSGEIFGRNILQPQTPQANQPSTTTHQFSIGAWKKANPKGDVNAAKKAAKAAGYQVVN